MDFLANLLEFSTSVTWSSDCSPKRLYIYMPLFLTRYLYVLVVYLYLDTLWDCLDVAEFVPLAVCVCLSVDNTSVLWYVAVSVPRCVCVFVRGLHQCCVVREGEQVKDCGND